jgi:2-polyprenyl-6-methoxyphenol hydroxylase-like FAD-dependent oxidoreductase
VGRPTFEFPALTYWPEKPSHRMAYLSLFPIGATMRANLMVYREMNDPWLKRMRSTPREALNELMPRLGRLLGAYEVEGFVKIRPADLYATKGHLQPGLALVGDAFATSCPAAGTGTNKVFTDVERLCNVHIPAWLATEGMGLEKIATFYDDPVKREADASSLAKAYWLRSLSIDTGAVWRARRQARVLVGIGRNALRGRRPLPASSSGSYRPAADGALNG